MKMYPIFQSCLMIDLGRETDGYNENCLGVRFALCIVGSHDIMQSWYLFPLQDTSVERRVKPALPPLTSMCSYDEQNVCVVSVSILTLISGAREYLGVGCFEVVQFQILHSSLS